MTSQKSSWNISVISWWVLLGGRLNLGVLKTNCRHLILHPHSPSFCSDPNVCVCCCLSSWCHPYCISTFILLLIDISCHPMLCLLPVPPSECSQWVLLCRAGVGKLLGVAGGVHSCLANPLSPAWHLWSVKQLGIGFFNWFPHCNSSNRWIHRDMTPNITKHTGKPSFVVKEDLPKHTHTSPIWWYIGTIGEQCILTQPYV